MTRSTSSARVDLVVALGLGVLYVVWLLLTQSALGYARDEGFYFSAAQSYRGWFELLFRDASAALEPGIRDQYWRVNAEHPAFIKTLFVFSRWLFFDVLGWFSTAGAAYRFVGMLSAGGTVSLLCVWGSQVSNRWVGVTAALCFALLPRVFFHAHLSCFDVPVTFMWFVVCYAYYTSLSSRGWGWPVLTGVLFGLLLNTKHNSWLLPPVVVLHFALMVLHARRVDARPYEFSKPHVLVTMALLGPCVFYATWPWLWSDTFRRLSAYAAFHLHHEYYNMEFLGRTYYEPPMPRLYAWLMTAATVPATVLGLFLVGGLRALREASTRGWFAGLGRLLRSGALPNWLTERGSFQSLRDLVRETPARAPSRRYAAYTLWGLGLLAGYAPWWSTRTPIFGGTKHWLVAYPFLALFAGLGLDWLVKRWREIPTSALARAVAPFFVALVVLLPSFVITWSSQPFGLSAYTPLVGGAPGAASLGLNRTFWGYTTGSLQDEINHRMPGGATLYLHDTARSSFAAMQRDGRIRGDIKGTLDISRSDYALYHHEPHMRRVEYQIWVDYGTLRPSAVAAYDGVPVAWLYARPIRAP